MLTIDMVVVVVSLAERILTVVVRANGNTAGNSQKAPASSGGSNAVPSPTRTDFVAIGTLLPWACIPGNIRGTGASTSSRCRAPMMMMMVMMIMWMFAQSFSAIIGIATAMQAYGRTARAVAARIDIGEGGDAITFSAAVMNVIITGGTQRRSGPTRPRRLDGGARVRRGCR